MSFINSTTAQIGYQAILRLFSFQNILPIPGGILLVIKMACILMLHSLSSKNPYAPFVYVSMSAVTAKALYLV
jgi:hypothetical protein